jgi:hypothetical protein
MKLYQSKSLLPQALIIRLMHKLLVTCLFWVLAGILEGMVHFEQFVPFWNIPTPAHCMIGVVLSCCHLFLNVSGQVKLHSSHLGSSLAAFQDFMGNPVLTIMSG